MEFLVDAVDTSTGEAVAKCELCGKFSKQKHNMRRHMILMHSKPTTNVCQYCSKIFKQPYNLNRHIKSRKCMSKMLYDRPLQLS